MEERYLADISMWQDKETPESERKDPYWQIRHNPGPKLEDYCDILVYYNGKTQIDKSFGFEDKANNEIERILGHDDFEKIGIKLYNLDLRMTEFCLALNGSSPEGLNYLIGKAEYEICALHGRQAVTKNFGSIGYLLEGSEKTENCLFAVTSGHVLLEPDDMKMINRAHTVQQKRLRSTSIANKFPTKNAKMYIDLHNHGHLITGNSPAFGYSERYDQAETGSKAATGNGAGSNNKEKMKDYDYFLQDVALLKIESDDKIKIEKLLSAHEKNTVEGALEEQKWEIIRSVLRIENEGDIKKLEDKNVKIVVGGITGYLVKGTHAKCLIRKESEDTHKSSAPIRKAECEPSVDTHKSSARLNFVTEQRLIPSQSGSAVYAVTTDAHLVPMGIFRGLLNKHMNDDSRTVYEAAPLWPNMKYIEAYTDVKNLRYKQNYERELIKPRETSCTCPPSPQSEQQGGATANPSGSTDSGGGPHDDKLCDAKNKHQKNMRGVKLALEKRKDD